jgi:hypothetical protein
MSILASECSVDKDEQSSQNDTDADHNNFSPPSKEQQPDCGLYIAPSTIPNAGLGIFTAVSRQEDDIVGYGDPVLPVIDLPFHNGKATGEFFNIFRDYVWNAHTHGMHLEGNHSGHTQAWCPGLDSAVNGHLGLINVDRGGFEYDDAVGGHRSSSPSAGAMTPYHNQLTVALEDIPAGGELFKHYGDHWFQIRENVFGLIPMRDDYRKADKLLKSLRKMEDTLNLSQNARQDLYSILKQPFWASRTLNAIPRNYTLVTIAVSESLQALYQQFSTRSLNHLAEHGRCIDNMQPKNSTLPFAGRGAFATRELSNGSIITGSPLMHIPFGDMAKMWGTMQDEDGSIVRNTSNFVGFQLWYNYCFGHGDSTLLLCPYGSGVNYINHNQTLANVKIQWAPHGTVAQNETWLHMDPSEMENIARTNLGIDYVAMRDIHQGEELFMDYGNDFEQAWREHVLKWKPTDKDLTYVSATKWNEEFANEDVRTEIEQQTDPYPDNLLLCCHPKIWLRGECRNFESSKLNIAWSRHEKGHLCKVHDRITDDNRTIYTVEVRNAYNDRSRICAGVPRQALAMMNEKYTTDWHNHGTFRHFIGIPDEMMPQKWKNARLDVKDSSS